MSKPNSALLNRRSAVVGAGALGALATAVAVLPRAPEAPVQTAEAPKAVAGGGYQLTDHVRQYYATARI